MMSCGSWLLAIPVLLLMAGWFAGLKVLGLDADQSCWATILVVALLAFSGRRR